MRNVVKGIVISAGMWLLLGCDVFSILPQPMKPLTPRPLVIATATPAAGQLHVTQTYTATSFAPPTASSTVTLTQPLDLHLDTKPSGIFVVVIAKVRNTGNTPLELAQAEFTLVDDAGHGYARAPHAELALSVAQGPVLSVARRQNPASANTAPLTDHTVPSSGQATGFLVFDVSPTYVPPFHLTARIPGSPPLISIPFTLEED